MNNQVMKNKITILKKKKHKKKKWVFIENINILYKIFSIIILFFHVFITSIYDILELIVKLKKKEVSHMTQEETLEFLYLINPLRII